MTVYVDSDSIFRFIRGRDELHYKHHLFIQWIQIRTDDSMPQWKQVMYDCRVKVIHALSPRLRRETSPQAKGKIERPYGWIQDHLVRI
jgi:hypothetical protein